MVNETIIIIRYCAKHLWAEMPIIFLDEYKKRSLIFNVLVKNLFFPMYSVNGANKEIKI